MQPYQSPNEVEDPKRTIVKAYGRQKWPAISVLVAYLLLVIAYFSLLVFAGATYGSTIFGYVPPSTYVVRATMCITMLVCIALATMLVLAGLIRGGWRTKVAAAFTPVFYVILLFLSKYFD